MKWECHGNLTGSLDFAKDLYLRGVQRWNSFSNNVCQRYNLGFFKWRSMSKLPLKNVYQTQCHTEISFSPLLDIISLFYSLNLHLHSQMGKQFSWFPASNAKELQVPMFFQAQYLYLQILYFLFLALIVHRIENPCVDLMDSFKNVNL